MRPEAIVLHSPQRRKKHTHTHTQVNTTPGTSLHRYTCGEMIEETNSPSEIAYGTESFEGMETLGGKPRETY